MAPGTELREAIDRILNTGNGALIVIGNMGELRPIMSGGFNINCEFTAPRLFELSKMDGAVVLSRDRKTINWSNGPPRARPIDTDPRGGYPSPNRRAGR